MSGIDAGRAVDLSSIVNRPAPGTGAAGSSAAGSIAGASGQEIMMPALVLQTNDETFSSVLELSNAVPVLVCFVMDPEQDEEMLLTLSEAIFAAEGRAILVTVDAASSPQLVGSFQAEALSAAEGGATPVVAAVIAGRPLQLFAGTQPASVVAQVVQQLVTVARESGIDGRVTTPQMAGGAGGAGGAGSVETGASEGVTDGAAHVPDEPLPPLHQEAFDAIERADYVAAADAYERALKENPKDDMARAGLAQVSLLERLKGKTLAEVRQAAAANPADLNAAFDVADLDLSGGHIDDAFDRLLTFFVTASPEERDLIRRRLLELFDVVGASDPRVTSARAKLTSLLF